MSRVCNCETDGQHYVRCTCCDEYVIEGEFEAHRHSCPGQPVKSGQQCGGAMRGPAAGSGDIGDFLGCLTGTVKFGPGWDQPLPREDWGVLW